MIPKGSTGKWRLILDMSSPEGMSVNDGIREAPCSLSYVSVEDAAKGVMAKGRGALMAKVDVQSAYRNVPIHPEDRWLMGMLWEGGLYIDTALPFGLRSAPKIFTAIADAVEWISRQEGVDFILHYMDNFLVVGSPGSRECRDSLTTLLSVFNWLGLPVAMEKLEGPQSHLTFLGFELDATALVIWIPPEKLTELQLLIWSWVGRKSCAKRELESLVGKLGHAARVVAPGRTFMRRMFELLAGVRQAHHHNRLSLAFRSDLLWWATLSGGMERNHDDADPHPGATGPPSMDRRLGPLWLRGRIPFRTCVVTVGMAALLPLRGDATSGGEYPSPRTRTHHLGLCPLGAGLAGLLGRDPL